MNLTAVFYLQLAEHVRHQGSDHFYGCAKVLTGLGVVRPWERGQVDRLVRRAGPVGSILGPTRVVYAEISFMSDHANNSLKFEFKRNTVKWGIGLRLWVLRAMSAMKC